MAIYTRTGDKGTTGIGTGKRLPKDHLIIEVLGQIDELNSSLGFSSSSKKIKPIITNIQSQLFYLAAEIAGRPSKNFKINPNATKDIEKLIDHIDKKLPPLKNFIYPVGSPIACHLFLSRAICRRLERTIVSLNRKTKLPPEILSYINRLSDLLFILARYANKISKIKEKIWKTNTEKPYSHLFVNVYRK